MKRIIFVCVAVFLSLSLPAQNSGKQWNFSGRWAWEYIPDSTMELFSVALLPPDKTGKIIGKYSYITYYGRRIDQGSVKMLSHNGNKAVLRFDNCNHDRRTIQNYHIALLNDTMMYFVGQEPKLYWLPDSVVLVRTQKAEEVTISKW